MVATGGQRDAVTGPGPFQRRLSALSSSSSVSAFPADATTARRKTRGRPILGLFVEVPNATNRSIGFWMGGKLGREIGNDPYHGIHAGFTASLGN